MRTLRNGLRAFISLYRLRFDDMELVRAQFRAFVQQIPLLYFVLAANAAAVAVACRRIDAPGLTRGIPAVICLVALTRGAWWWRSRASDFPDAEICRHLRNTSLLASGLAAVIVVWMALLYPLGNAWERGHVVFFVAITQISCVFYLMPVRPAALGVATIGIAPLTAFLLFADHGVMWVEAETFALVGVAMVFIMLRYNRSFAELIGSQRDLRAGQLEAERLSEENRSIAFTDALSGLPNRRALIARLENLHTRIASTPGQVAILFADLDGFKKINDDHGHQLGDALICHLGEAFGRIVPPHAMLARMGGDEFAILVETENAIRAAVAIGERVLACLARSIVLHGHEIHVGASIGIAGCGDYADAGCGDHADAGCGDHAGHHEDAIDAYELLRRADSAMYRVKAGGRSGLEIYDPSIDRDRLWRQRIEAEIRHGLATDEFEVAYQPVLDAGSGMVVAVEALLRWPRREAGALPPDEFIPIAEASGLIHPLGLFVLRRAARELRAAPGLRLNVNISPAQFRQPRFEAEVAGVLAETGFPPERLQIEITEGYLFDHPDRAAQAIASFRALGASVALDDFGSGFASIGYLRAYGFGSIKIDKSLIANLGEDPKAAMLVTGIVHLAKALDLRVTAEGVETETQAAMLRLAGCDELQGYLFGHPSPLAQAIAASLPRPARRGAALPAIRRAG